MVRRTLHTRPDRLIGPDEDCWPRDGDNPAAEGSCGPASRYPRLDWLLDIMVGVVGTPHRVHQNRACVVPYSQIRPVDVRRAYAESSG